VHGLQILNGGAPCQQIDSQEEDEQEAEAEDEVSTRDTLHALSQHMALLLLCSCSALLCCAVPRCAVPCCAVLCCAVLCCAVLCGHIICSLFDRGFALRSCCQSQACCTSPFTFSSLAGDDCVQSINLNASVSELLLFLLGHLR